LRRRRHLKVRISLTEHLAVEANGARLDEKRFPGRQGRIVFAYLAAQNGRAVPRDELAELLWGDELPATWEKALRVLMTKLRALLDECGLDGSAALTSAFGCYKLTLPADAWIDVDAAVEAVERAEAELAAGDLDEARSQATVAAALARRSFLPGEDGSWVEQRRRDLREVLVRSLECLRDASFGAGELAEAVRYAEEVTELEPFRESTYRRLMQAHLAGATRPRRFACTSAAGVSSRMSSAPTPRPGSRPYTSRSSARSLRVRRRTVCRSVMQARRSAVIRGPPCSSAHSFSPVRWP
jgi:DNA-binding SARP family transcriptional activator